MTLKDHPIVGRTYRYFNVPAPEPDPMNHKRVRVVGYDAEQELVWLEGLAHAYPAESIQSLRPSNAAIDVMIDSWDGGDPWGSGMSMLGACCDVLHAVHADELIEPGAGYRPGAGQDDSLEELADETYAEEWQIPFDTHELAIAFETGEVGSQEIGRATRILHLYLNLVRDAGLDY